jgi:hypothetical protein
MHIVSLIPHRWQDRELLARGLGKVSDGKKDYKHVDGESAVVGLILRC